MKIHTGGKMRSILLALLITIPMVEAKPVTDLSLKKEKSTKKEKPKKSKPGSGTSMSVSTRTKPPEKVIVPQRKLGSGTSMSVSTRTKPPEKVIVPQRKPRSGSSMSVSTRTKPPEKVIVPQRKLGSGMSMSVPTRTKPPEKVIVPQRKLGSGTLMSVSTRTKQPEKKVVSNPEPSSPVLVGKSVYTPEGWNPQYHRTELQEEYGGFDPRKWGAGYFFYNPPKNNKTKVVNRHQGKDFSKQYHPKKQVDRTKKLSLGARGMSYHSGYVDGGDYRDLGFGVAMGYRPIESVGVELSYSQFSQDFGESSDRLNIPLQAVGQVYLFPWTKVSPYLSAGYAWNQLEVDDYYRVNGEERRAIQEAFLTGPVFGAGVSFAISKSLGVSAEGRYLMFNNLDENDPARDNGLILTSGINLYF